MKGGMFAQKIEEILFPVFCVACGQEGEWWCQACREKERLTMVLRCPVCGVDTPRGEACHNCQAVSPLDGLTALFNYQDSNSVGKLIRQFKYAYAKDITTLWNEIIAQYSELLFRPRLDFISSSVIPVPLYGRRERARGYNQAALIAKALGQSLRLFISTSGLKRIRHTAQQAKLSRVERQKNVAGAFGWENETAPPPSVILVDDVYTTGATMEECARILKCAGAQKVCGFVLARD